MDSVLQKMQLPTLNRQRRCPPDTTKTWDERVTTRRKSRRPGDVATWLNGVSDLIGVGGRATHHCVYVGRHDIGGKSREEGKNHIGKQCSNKPNADIRYIWQLRTKNIKKYQVLRLSTDELDVQAKSI